ncbi:MAG TPA: hypothetical protein VL484_11075 [Vicinamibacterales bacterium]|nr:hypothetical protein [Vicinamibacterales bacterium]
MPDAGEHVVQRTAGGFRETHAVGGDDRHVKRGGEVAQHVVVGFLVAEQVALQFDEYVRAPENADEPVDESAHAELRAAQHRPPCERNQTGGAAVEFVERQRALSFGRPQLHRGHEAAQIPVPRPVLYQHGKLDDRFRTEGRARLARWTTPGPLIADGARRRTRRADRQLGADHRVQAGFLRGHVETRSAVHAVAIEQRERRIAERRRALDEGLGQRRAVEKGECGSCT